MSRRLLPFATLLVLTCRGERPSADPGAILTARTLGLAYIEENRLPEAEEQFLKLIGLVPDEPSGHANLGLVHLRMGRYDEAQREIDRAVKLAPDDPDIRLLQATALRLRGHADDARRTLEAALKTSAAHVKTLYALAALDSANRERYLQRLVEAAPANIPARLALADALLQRGAITEARDQLELLRQRLPSLPSQADRFYAASVNSVQANRAADARRNLASAKAFLETTAAYQAGLAELRSPDGVPPGYPVLTLNPRLALLQHDPLAVVKALRFTDATAGAKAPAIHAAAGDYDNDGHLDYFDQGALFHNTGDDTFTRSNALDVPDATTAVFADLDHDGDLDLFVGSPTADRFYRNNGDGTFREMATAAGLAGSGATGAAFGDFDNDGRLDLVVARASGVTTYKGGEEGRFAAVATLPSARAVAVGDYDNDGFLDLYAGGFYHNDGTGKLTRDSRADVPRADVSSAAFFDFDNDGWLDVIAATRARLVLLHNNEHGRFTDRFALLPAHVTGRVLPSDVDDDGDLDVVVAGNDGAHLLRNDGGNVNQFAKVGLVALREGSGKNNSFGIGSRVELRAKDLYQMRVADQPVLHFGLGNRLKPDVLKVTWTNGVPQTYYYPGGSAAGEDRNVLEQQVLKGSCTFLYTWDGTAYQFLTDVTWASALGMPLGMMAGEKTIYGPPQAAREYFRVPGERLRPRGGRYRVQLTEELWEVAYVDQLELLAVDHPDSVDVLVDERFVPPGTPGAGELAIRQVARERLPIAATDDRGRDLLPQIRAKDDDYVGGFTPGPYQGVTAPHDFVLDFGAVPEGGGPTRLVLQGWLFPADASINAAIAQSKAVQILPPVIQVPDKTGHWRRVADLTFPAGKDKSIIVDMTGKWLSPDRRIRIRTNLEIYWDHAFLALGEESAPLTVTRLKPVTADLHARGWSRVYRKGGSGRYGPFWFDYAQVSKQSPWRPVGGNFTRYGDVLALLDAADDQAVILASGDEMTVEFPEAAAPALPAGWKRDFLLYNVAWMKDADLHTAAGQTVEPLPFHAATRYPYAPEQHYPDDAAHRRYVAEYNTRRIVP